MKNYQRGDSTILAIFVAILAVSLLGNAYLYHEKGKEHDLRTTAEANLETANDATQTCNDSIAGLERAALARGRQAERNRADAKAKAEALQRSAQVELSTPPTVPGDDCKSAQDRVKRVLSARSKP